MEKKYSVLMSVYKNEKSEYLKRALDSMLLQTVKPNEVVLVEDGPLTEELYMVINDYVSKYSDLFVIVKNKTNLGLGKSLANGLSYCKNEFVARMDTDDVSLPDRCEKQLAAFSINQEVSVVGGNISEFIGEEENIVGYRNVKENHEDIVKYMKKRCPLNHVTVMFKKLAVERVGGYIEWHYNEDYYLWIRLYLAGKKFYNVQETLVNVRVGKDMYARRGGWKYFKSERGIQKLMKKNKIIGFGTYFMNVIKRFIVQVMLPNKLRAWVFKKFARN